MTTIETATGNMYLEGPFAPVDHEVTAHELQVTGTIPAELNGRLLRNGPNPIDPEDPQTDNWFSSNGMVHGASPTPASSWPSPRACCPWS